MTSLTNLLYQYRLEQTNVLFDTTKFFIPLKHINLHKAEIMRQNRGISNYWIYNWIRAVFFQKFERLFKKNMYNSIIQSISHLKIWLFPIFLAICGFHPKRTAPGGGQEWIKPIFDTLFWCEPYSSGGVLHRPEQMVDRRGKIWAIRRVG